MQRGKSGAGTVLEWQRQCGRRGRRLQRGGGNGAGGGGDGVRGAGGVGSNGDGARGGGGAGGGSDGVRVSAMKVTRRERARG